MKTLAILSIIVALIWGIDCENCNAAVVFLVLMIPMLTEKKVRDK